MVDERAARFTDPAEGPRLAAHHPGGWSAQRQAHTTAGSGPVGMVSGLTALVIAGVKSGLLLASLLSLAYVAIAVARLRRYNRRRPMIGAAGRR